MNVPFNLSICNLLSRFCLQISPQSDVLQGLLLLDDAAHGTLGIRRARARELNTIGHLLEQSSQLPNPEEAYSFFTALREQVTHCSEAQAQAQADLKILKHSLNLFSNILHSPLAPDSWQTPPEVLRRNLRGVHFFSRPTLKKAAAEYKHQLRLRNDVVELLDIWQHTHKLSIQLAGLTAAASNKAKLAHQVLEQTLQIAETLKGPWNFMEPESALMACANQPQRVHATLAQLSGSVGPYADLALEALIEFQLITDTSVDGSTIHSVENGDLAPIVLE